MAKVTNYFKCLFVFFNILFGIAGCVILALGVIAHVLLNQTEYDNSWTGVICLYVIGGVTVGISFLGVYGALKGKKFALIGFFIGMCVGCIALLRIAIPAAIMRPEVSSMMEGELQGALPLDRASLDVQRVANKIQMELKCCGIFSHQDWGSDVPDSCLCSPSLGDTCEESQSHVLMFLSQASEKDVYKQTCGPIILSYLDKVFDIILGILFGFAALALMGAVMSTILLIQLRNPTMKIPMIFSVNAGPPKYTELFNSPEK